MINTGDYSLKPDNFIVVQDATITMNQRPDKSFRSGPTKLDISKGLVRCMNRSLPDNLDLTAGMSVYGFTASKEKDGLVYGMTDFSSAGLEGGVQAVKDVGSMRDTIDPLNDVSNDLKQVSGRTAVILLSDGAISEKVDHAASAEALKKMYGENVCIYTILLGNDPAGQETMQNIASAGQCGFAIVADNLYMKPLDECDTVNVGKGMGDFVTRVFLEKDSDGDGVGDSRDLCPDTPEGVKVDNVGCPLDRDGDGIPDYLDKCPDTPSGIMVDELGCPLPDSDGDGVLDIRDRCPDTPPGVKVDSSGCPIPIKEKVTITLNVEFDFDKSNIRQDYIDDIEKVANLLKAYPKTTVELEGHTDSIGPEDYNMGLSKRRAESVKRTLVERFNIDASRITTTGYGETRPVDTNDTPAGRQNNRRVDAFIEAVFN
ncbi:MAG: OmpA family protein [Deltaproteobacteria bacterium]|jgi:OOP family OmpA-OmpF porin|nr:OmpA family protein [Deltaproteobacteria bacterium]